MPRRMSKTSRDKIMAQLQEDPQALGPQLGLIAMKYSIPVRSYAIWLDVTEECVRRWFYGTSRPREAEVKTIKRLLVILRRALLAHEFPLVGSYTSRVQQMDAIVRRHASIR